MGSDTVVSFRSHLRADAALEVPPENDQAEDVGCLPGSGGGNSGRAVRRKCRSDERLPEELRRLRGPGSRTIEWQTRTRTSRGA